MTEEEKKTKLIKWGTEITHFLPQEFDSPDAPGSGLEFMNLEFVKILDKGRAATGFSWSINSGYRTEEHNKAVGGQGPEHCQGNAADIRTENGLQMMAIVKWAISVGINRIGIGNNYVHLGFSFNLPQNVMWTYYGGL